MTFLAINNLDAIVGVGIFGLVLSVWFIALFLWQLKSRMRSVKVERRLGLIDGSDEAGQGSRVLRLWHEGEEIAARVQGKQTHVSRWERIDQVCKEAGYSAPTSVLLFGVAGMTVVVFMFAMMLSGVMAAVACTMAVPFLFWTITRTRSDKCKARFDSQFVEALELTSRSLRAGHPLLTAFQLASEELQSPVREVFFEIVQSQDMGLSLEQALSRASANAQSNDLKLFATCVVIQLRSGGNLADMMERLADVIRDRLRLGRRVRVLTAQTQFSKRVLLILPFIVFAILNLINGDYMLPMYNTFLGQMMLAVAGGCLILGSWSMNMMSRLKY